MSAQYIKTKLKSAREAIAEQRYEDARETASDVLSHDSSNYNARIFLALSLLNLGKDNDSEGNYLQAIEQYPKQALAYQGLGKLYEQTKQWDKLAKLLQTQLDTAVQEDDEMKCGEYVQKLMDLKLSHGTRQEMIDALSSVLDDSPYIHLLRRLPDPEPSAPTASGLHQLQLRLQDTLPTLLEVIRLIQKSEDDIITAEVSKRRMRLGGPSMTAEETKKAVQREHMGTSRLPYLYRQILEHPSTSDELRRSTEANLLTHLLTYLASLPSGGAEVLQAPFNEVQHQERRSEVKKYRQIKEGLAAQVKEMAHGMVLVRVPHPKAWQIELDWQDVSSAKDYDNYTLRRMPDLFNESDPLTRVVSGFLAIYDHKQSLPSKETVNGDISDDAEFSQEDFLAAEDRIQSGLNECRDSLCAHLLALHHFTMVEDLSATKDLCEAALEVMQSTADQTCLAFPLMRRYINVNLAHALVHLEPPTHHGRALRVLNDLLDDQPDDLRCLADKGFVLSAASRWSEAVEALERCRRIGCDDRMLDLQIQSELSAAKMGLEDWSAAERLLQALLTSIREESESGVLPESSLSGIRAKVHWQLGQCLLKTTSPKSAYTSFIQSLKSDPAYAPAFTALGVYYLSSMEPPDHAKASKCLQKAFELDSTQEEAARLLAQEFSLSGDWDLVEVIARRAIAHISSVRAGQHAKAQAARYAWAWRAIGVADLKNQKFATAATAFQHALRGQPEDYTSWVRLGLSYKGSGKHVAALKTFGHVIANEPTNWAALFAAADIQRSIGLLDPALVRICEALKLQPESIALRAIHAEMLLSKAGVLLRQGFRQRPREYLLECLDVAKQVVHDGSRQASIWKTVADAANLLSRLKTSLVEDGDYDSVSHLREILRQNESASTHSIYLGDMTKDLPRALALEAYRMRLLLDSESSSTYHSAWADLGIAIFELNRSRKITADQRRKATLSSITCLRRALKHDSRNFTWWLALGSVSFGMSPKLTQHAFIKAAELNSRSPKPWTNLGLFYLQQNAIDLANKSFLRAQTLDPEWASAWIGQACLAAINGDEHERRALISHAAFLAGGSLAPIDFEYAKLANLSGNTQDSISLASALHALQRYLATHQDDPEAFYLLGNLLERSDSLDSAAKAFESAAKLYEEDYESSESEDIAKRYIAAMTAQGRCYLSLGRYSDACELVQTALDLSEDGSTERCQAQMVYAQAQAKLGNLAEAIAVSAEAKNAATALSESRLLIKATIVHARILWLSGEAADRKSAEDALLEIVSDRDADLDVEVIAILASMAIASKDAELLEAAVAELQDIPRDKLQQLDPQHDVTSLMVAHRCGEGNYAAAETLLQEALQADPDDGRLRLQLARVYLAEHRPKDVLEVLEALMTKSAESLKYQAQALRDTDDGDNHSGAAEIFQRAVHLKPWEADLRRQAGLAM